MSSPNWIGRKTETGAEYILCNWGGYIDRNGKILHENYKTDDQVKELLSFGEARSIDITVDECEFYLRDMDDEYAKSKTTDVNSDYKPNGAENYEYCFLWNKGEWWVTNCNFNGWQQVKDLDLTKMNGVDDDE